MTETELREILSTITDTEFEIEQGQKIVSAFAELEAEVERLNKYKMFFESCSCYFAEGVEFMTKDEIYAAIKKETKQLECWEGRNDNHS